MPPLLTLFTAPKAFTNAHIALIQRNALACWSQLGPEVEIFIVGAEPGLAEAAAGFNLAVLPNVERSPSGTPLVSSIFALGRAAAHAPLLAFTNADMLYLPDLLAAARQALEQAERFLLIGQRWDLDLRQAWDFSPGWEARLQSEVRARGRLHLPAGSDYFIFPRALFTEMPAFAIGRAGWDNWMIYHARTQGWPVVDATPAITAIHQDHDYSHLPGGKPHYNHPESQANSALAGGSGNLYMLLDSDRELRNGRLQAPRPTFLRTLRRIELAFTPAGGQRRGLKWAIARQARRLRRRMTGSL